MEKVVLTILTIIIIIVVGSIFVNGIYAQISSAGQKPHHLKILVRQPDRAYFDYPYKFTVKAFDLTINPDPKFDSFEGLVSDVRIIAVVEDKMNGDIQKNFTGITDKFGYYQDWYKIINYPKHENFQVIFNASKNGYTSTSDVETLFIMHLPASYYGGNSTR